MMVPSFSQHRCAAPGLLLALLVGACGGDNNAPSEPTVDAVDDSGADVATDGVEDTGPDIVEDTGPDIVEPDVVEDADTGTEDTLCAECTANEDCAGIGALCLTFPQGGQFCGIDCADNAAVCPAGFQCAVVDQFRGTAQCVPDDLFCVNPCDGVECDEGLICDPFQDGACVPPLGICEECVSNDQCGGPGDLCLRFNDIDERTGCTTDCTADPESCPEGYNCVPVTTPEGEVSQCVPEIGTCIDRCEGLECDEGEVCDPRIGECSPPSVPCDPCTSDLECGTDADLCIGLPGPPCTEDADCGPDEFCNTEGACVAPVCGQDCAPDPETGVQPECPAGFACYNLNGGAQQCLPIDLACTERCADVECDADENCDPVTTECTESVLSYCSTPCIDNASCLGQDDICLNVGAGAFCTGGCDDATPCPVGYQCLETFTDTQHCIPNNFEFSCDACSGVECEEGQACDPQTGRCYALPAICGGEEDPECERGTLCATSDRRCEPIGMECTFEFRTQGCDFGIMRCTSPREGLNGTCEETCFSDTDCPADRPVCGRYHGVLGSVCMPAEIGGADTCARLSSSLEPIGQPCDTEDDPLDPSACTSSVADYCLEGFDGAVGGICTRECVTDEDCGASAVCAEVEDGSFCIPNDCGCALDPELADGETDLLGDRLDTEGLTRCDLAWPLIQRRLVYGPTDIDDAYRVPALGPVAGDPLQGLTLLQEEIQNVSFAPVPSQQLRAAAAAWNVPAPEPELVFVDLDTTTFSVVMDDFVVALGGEPLEGDTLTDLEALPLDVREGLANLVANLQEIALAQRVLFDLEDPLVAQAYAELHATVFAGETDLSLLDPAVIELVADATVRAELIRLALWLDAAIQAFPERFTEDVSAVTFDFETPIGRFVIAGESDDTHDMDGSVALLVELGGDDTYTGSVAANRGADQPFAIVIDLSGADSYAYEEWDGSDAGRIPDDGSGRATPVRGGDGEVSLSDNARQGAGRFGFGVLVDRGEGLDTYASLRLSQGFGLMGVGMLIDVEGDVEMTAEALSQGAGVFGVGVVSLGDAGAVVRGFSGTMGFGGPAGVGVFAAGFGDDVYIAEVGDPTSDTDIYGNRVGFAPGNLSASLGAGLGFGPRASSGNDSVSGGVGIFVEAGGSDTYTMDNGAAGFGHRHGGGFFYDALGDDTYAATSLAWGAAAEFGVGRFVDADGGDVYTGTDLDPESSYGFGEDLATGLFYDMAGDDEYTGGLFTHGVGTVNGFGFFAEGGGNDVYDASATDSWGVAVLTLLGREPDDNPRREVGTFGIFLDLAGADTYDRPDASGVGERRSWTQVPDEEVDLPVYGLGTDGQGGF